CDEQEPTLRPPERRLAPPAQLNDRAQLERRPWERARHDVVWHAEAARDGRAVAAVPVEQLHDTGRLAELSDPLVQLRPVDDVEEPDVSVDLPRTRGACPPPSRHPAGGVRKLVDRSHVRSSCAKASSNTASG